MKLIDEIIDLASSDSGSVATLLRKCLVLAHTLRNDRLKTWAEHELNGYNSNDDTVPEYRKTRVGAKGHFLGPFGAEIRGQPIPPAVLQKEHRRYAESVVLFQPIAAYEDVDGDSCFRIEWPSNLTLIYQQSFFDGYNLNHAWQDIPSSVIRGLVDTIRTRVLRFALELRDDLGLVGDDLSELPKEKIDRGVVNFIFGGTNVIGSKDFAQINKTVHVGQGDWIALADALKQSGVDTGAISELKSALDQDAKDTHGPGIGKRASDWLKQIGKKAGGMATSVGIEVLKNWILQFLGPHSH